MVGWILTARKRRIKSIIIDFSTNRWFLSVDPNISKYVQQRLTGSQWDSYYRVITNLYSHDIDGNITKTIDSFWGEFK